MATLAVAVALLMVLIILAPIQFALEADANRDVLSYRATVTTLWGALGACFVSKNGSRTMSVIVGGRNVLTKPLRTERRKKRRPSNTNLLALLPVAPEFSRLLTQYLAIIIRSVKSWKISARLRFGFQDPADTGFLFGLYEAGRAVLSTRVDLGKVQVEPVFDGTALEGSGQLRIKIRPRSLFLPTLRFLLSRSVRHTWR